MTIYDKALEYISGGSNLQDIRTYFWKWRRSHYPRTEHNLERTFTRILKKLQIDMQSLGVFGHTVADDEFDKKIAECQKDGLKNPQHAKLASAAPAGAEVKWK